MIAARCTFEQGCSDCDLRTIHPTAHKAARSAIAHETETGHWALMSDWNGWHRPRAFYIERN